jgi:hypothetical protein
LPMFGSSLVAPCGSLEHILRMLKPLQLNYLLQPMLSSWIYSHGPRFVYHPLDLCAEQQLKLSSPSQSHSSSLSPSPHILSLSITLPLAHLLSSLPSHSLTLVL